MPYEIISPFFDVKNVGIENGIYVHTLTKENINSINITWNNQFDYTNNENAIVVADGSGSMYDNFKPVPIVIAISLAMYFAERNKGTFKNKFITFSEYPQMGEIVGNNIFEKLKYCLKYNEPANTDIQKVFSLILKTAVINHTPQSEMPNCIYIISDMEFDSCTRHSKATNFEYAQKMFETKGYKLPKLVFWNVLARQTQFPVRINDNGVILVSGYSSKIFEMVVKSETVNNTPYQFMLKILNTERYSKITA